ncbi:gluconokinase [Mesorhizobium sp. M7A.F.Ca.CA.001.07.2.1]|nr:gluconokinase [Mesorhizobium sp. M7A.F.Ca.CA.004.08.2.1]RUX85621.1 gluconokinase [Mesorhizobium sp. M7A.F.Ca.CA.004.08.1.1]RUY08344.1 gluconokinase [Mesorhizobium sp. M7A.F.Ca.CA.004.04.1.1]RUY32644.1 gluconokinase [Mesorhizobium sp. M7A.F.Ca.CA.004.12.1.1]RUY59117.1 gluconokinase [Mesorhizobium sp. M7A.F.Ca.CA.001.12.1.1]RUY85390.1 gluconokinase [Mesorhizobium sp. M7A.F.Ca.CA.001.10.2.1]RUZ58597.1 gluconokinase [Mesorhizobium sp. M7A.F.Ca.CA.004.05.2.1]RUZ92934.1 gluconokinase [Mesorhizo
MGVSGCGKTRIGVEIAERLGLPFIEGDTLHPPGNVEKMSAGIPLADDDRWPWLDLVGAALRQANEEGRGLVVSCSALKESYRDRLRHAVGGSAVFIFLEGSRALLQARLAERGGHFFPPALLDSQFAALENPDGEKLVVTVDINAPVYSIVDAALEGLGTLSVAPAAGTKREAR